MERFATGTWLTRRVVRAASAASLALTVAAVLYGLAARTGPHGTLDAAGDPLGTDFTMIWSAGRMALDGQAARIYDLAAIGAAGKATHGTEAVPVFGWHYPPVFLLVAAPLAAMPFLASLVLWQVASLGAALAAAWRILPSRDALLAGLGFPAVFVCLAHGHNAFLTAALFTGGLLLLERRPLLAGLLLGCLAYKPQFALILPVALAAGGHWRAIGGAALSGLGLAALSLALFGPGPWHAFLATAAETRVLVVENGATGWYKIGSAFAWARMLGASVAAAYMVQGVVAAGAVGATAWLWHARAPFRLRAACLLLGSLLATPYLLDYDLVLLGPAILFLAAHGLERGFRRWEASALALAWLVPVAARALAFFGHVPAAFGATAILFVLAAGRAIRETPAPRPAGVAAAC